MASSPALNSEGALKLTILSNGSAINDSIRIVSVEVNKSANKIPTAKIVILDGDMPDETFVVSDSDTFKPGAEITISAGYGDEDAVIFKGIVTKHGIKITGNNYARLVVECRDKAVAMTIGRKNANYVDKKDSDIITALIGNYSGLTADVGATTVQYKELVQYYCTDWDFMIARAEVNGMLVMADAGTVTAKAPQTSASAALTVTYGADLMEFHTEMDARTQLTSVKGTTWDLATQAVVEQQASQQTLNEQGDIDAATLAAVIGLSSYRLQSPVTMDTAALKAWADGQQLKAGLSRIRGRMKFQGSALAKPGCLVELKGVGNRFNGTVYVTAVNHEIENGNWFTEAEFGMSSDWFTQQQDVVSPAAAGVTPGAEGLQIGVVKKLDADPEGHYKIQVSVPVMQAETDGVWARLSNFYSSDGIGAFFLPEIGDEVVLGYFNNDPSHPVILGSLYSSKRKAPYEPEAKNNTKAIVTRTKMKVEFDEENKVITIITPGNNQIVISDKDKSILLQDQNNNKVTLGTSGISLESPKDIAIDAKGKVTIQAVGNIEMTAKADIKSTGLNITSTANVGFTAKGTATAELSASGQTTIKGAMVMIN